MYTYVYINKGESYAQLSISLCYFQCLCVSPLHFNFFLSNILVPTDVSLSPSSPSLFPFLSFSTLKYFFHCSTRKKNRVQTKDGPFFLVFFNESKDMYKIHHNKNKRASALVDFPEYQKNFFSHYIFYLFFYFISFYHGYIFPSTLRLIKIITQRNTSSKLVKKKL